MFVCSDAHRSGPSYCPRLSPTRHRTRSMNLQPPKFFRPRLRTERPSLSSTDERSRPSSAFCRGGRVSLAAGRTDPGAGAAADTGALIIHHHDFFFDLIVLVAVKLNKIALLVDPFQYHDMATTDLEAASASDAFSGIDRDEIIGHPAAAVARCK